MRRFRRYLGLLSVAALALCVTAQSAFAAQDYTAVTSGASAEVAAALPVGLAVVGLFVGVMVAYKLLRRVIRA